MSDSKRAEAALPAGPIARLPGLKPFQHLFDRILRGHLRIRIGEHCHEMHGTEAGPSGEIRLLKPVSFARRIATRGHVGLGESYMAGDWDSPDVTALLHCLAANQHALVEVFEGSWLNRVASLFRHRRRANTKAGSRRNIEAHYDLGNAFYRLWLDPSMTYSAAVFEREADTPEETLAQAQHNKYRRLLGLLEATPGQHLLEVGCGWGGFARTAASAGLAVTGITLSREQLAWAETAVAGSALAERLAFRLQDYRDVTERFDHIVSIEMFEAVGEAYWPAYMAMLKRCLKPGGRAALQVITIADSEFDGYKASPDFIQHYIFPGGMLPTVGRFDAAAAEAGLGVVARSFHGLDYARTLAAWRERFETELPAVRALGYDERFIRMWRYYLSYCEAGFRDRRIDVMQVALAGA
ncbi:MAG: cyclopropane-fatty-acyl-phospholipid synthase family protein [Thiohalocapsa sp.]|uniref:SAM-dependent methyltransferase n=1 Tax=Thiohalocapsa sp. TaxID=2497641 RepID=UPI0025D5DC3F|nr:cyclopropane-fatty-acyl-phospholipid synthase family protein [Thiohalocapsa sp.]MCG6939752.1 cyclopropane-fatty-acyl-phospholipid synthase family protein [Thiohalocapsa sp.]